jgi:hypothetical protein
MPARSKVEWIKNHWITALTVFAVAFLWFVSIGVVAGSDGSLEAWRVGYLVGGILAGSAILAGLWGLRNGRLKLWVANTLIVAGLVVFTLGYWWFLLIPPIIALVVLYAASSGEACTGNCVRLDTSSHVAVRSSVEAPEPRSWPPDQPRRNIGHQ